MYKFAITPALLMLSVSPTWAAVVAITDPGTTYKTDGLALDFTAAGDTMDGMIVTAYFGSLIETATWGDVGGGQARNITTGNGWIIREVGDTYENDWSLTNNTGLAMTRLVINAAPGRTVFDVKINSSNLIEPGKGAPDGSPTSEEGITFRLVGTQNPAAIDILATYQNKVQIGNNTAVGDLWTTLDLLFRNTGGLADGRTLTFQADTDNAAANATIEPATGPVPEPASLAMWAIGALGCTVAGYRRRKRAQSVSGSIVAFANRSADR